jgi:hypothetical protein
MSDLVYNLNKVFENHLKIIFTFDNVYFLIENK